MLTGTMGTGWAEASLWVAISAGAQGAKALPDFPLLIPLPIRLFRYSTEGRICFLSLW